MKKLFALVLCLWSCGVAARAGALPEDVASLTCREFGERVTAYTAEQTGPDARAEVILQTIWQSPMLKAVTDTMKDLDTEAHRRIAPAFMERFVAACPVVLTDARADKTLTVGDAFSMVTASLELDPAAPRWGLKDAPDGLDYDTMTCMEIVEASRRIPGRPHNPVNDLARAAMQRYLDAYDQSAPEDVGKARTAKAMLALLSASSPGTPCREVMDRAATEAGLERK